MEEFTVSSNKKHDMIDITGQVSEIVSKSGLKEGICTVYVPHATCAVLVNENWDPNVMDDIHNCLQKIIPEGKWKHDNIDGNGASHIKSAIIGPSEVIPVKDAKLLLGRWQDIMLADFDGPRQRTVIVTLTGK
ncbi:secondary thiamine-phosphate synthase enzyme YjbQ [Candidatus Woesearchaeota archaeon]|nr:secondary thiamine-phosphate synthase enzyme YjbQ [Candidatus Woesearchaeota archaeon]MBW3016854.1 secondary thiamine-phosphate synthase enzyme YjbQ [Candidatus Woesearchaeota archaeon]